MSAVQRASASREHPSWSEIHLSALQAVTRARRSALSPQIKTTDLHAAADAADAAADGADAAPSSALGSDDEHSDDDGAASMSEGSAGSEEGAPSEASGGSGGNHAEAAGAQRAAVALSVGVGSFSDPPDMQGLSHYLEHMLFMGSKAYPKENEYDDYLVKRAGGSNAYTDAEYTNFHFDVEPSGLRGALKRFAGFFTGPLCLESALEREVRRLAQSLSYNSVRVPCCLSSGTAPHVR